MLINLRKTENDDADAHHVRPIKNFQIFTGVPHDRCIRRWLRRKSVQLHGIVEIMLGSSENVAVEYLTKRLTYVIL